MAAKGALVIRFIGDTKDFGNSMKSATADAQAGAKGIGKLGGVGKLAAGGLLAASAAAVGLGKALGDALSQEKSSDRLAASLGATPKVAERFGKIAGNLYSDAWGDSMDDVNHAIESVASSFKSLGSGKALENVTRQALDFAAIFEVDLPRATQVASTVLKSGLAKNATEAFDLLTAASQRVPASLRSDVHDAAEEYGHFFKTLGFSGSQAFGVLVKGASKGMYGIDKAGDAIKEFTIRSTDMSAASKDAYKTIGLDAHAMTNSILAGGSKSKKAFNQILDGVLGIKDPAKQASTALALFGTPLEDLNVKDIPGFLKSLQAGSKGMKDWKGSIDDAGKTLNDNASTNLESFKRQLTQGIVNLIGGKVIPSLSKFSATMARDVGPIMQKVGKWAQANVIPAMRELGDTFRSVASDLGPTFSKLGALVRDVFSAFKGKFDTSAISEFVTYIQSAMKTVASVFKSAVDIATMLWKAFGDNILDFLRGTFSNVLSVLRGAFKVVEGIFDTVAGVLTGDWSRAWDGIKSIVQGAWLIVSGIVKQGWNVIVFAFKNAGVLVRAIMSKLWDGVRALTGKAWDGLKSLVRKGWANLIQPFRQAVPMTRALTGKLWDGVKALMARGWDKLRDLARAGWDKVIDFFRKAPGRIRSLIGNFVSTGRELAGRMFDAVRDKARDGIQNLVEKIREAPGKIKDLGGKFLEAGKEIIGKLISGLGDAGGALGDLGAKIKAAVNSALGLPRTISFNPPGPINFSTTIGAFKNGTLNAPKGLALVGEDGPELVQMRGGERVFTAAQSRRMADAPRLALSDTTPRRIVVEVRVVGGELDLTKAKVQLDGIAREVARDEIRDERAWLRTQE